MKRRLFLIIAILASALFLTTILPRVFGLTLIPAADPAMSTTYNLHQLIFIAPIDSADIKENQIIAFGYPSPEDNSATRLRHVISIQYYPTSDAREFFVQADNSAYPDHGSIAESDVLGRVALSIPFANWLAYPAVSVLLALIAVLFFVLFARCPSPPKPHFFM